LAQLVKTAVQRAEAEIDVLVCTQTLQEHIFRMTLGSD
jgi:hypothetical protein